ncbi:GH92 family glycosyl hydrolase [Amycolatopsis ultiminotia]|uniref:GH92 family glycosyl hydrolase n=1 Tax=Amycolatopsis ultiminotia TaxID=543629 RepID=A0ABP6VZA8_9PSEU
MAMARVRWRAGLIFVTTAVVAAVAPAVPAVAAGKAQDTDLAKWVNPYVGTRPGGEDHGTGGGAGNTFPGAVVPFGMVQWSPDTQKSQPGGYYYDDDTLTGFSLTHLSGAGCTTYQDLPFIPYVGDVTTSPAKDPAHYTSKFSHDNEHATAGAYDVTLDSGAKVELSATQRTGSARLSYPAGAASTLLVNTSGSVNGTSDASIDIGKDTISGWADSGKFCSTDSKYRVYFSAKFDQPFASSGTWKDDQVTSGKTAETGGSKAKVAQQGGVSTAKARPGKVKTQDTTVGGPGSGGYVTFANQDGAQVNVQVGLSFVSVDGAEANRKAENDGTKAFDDVAAAARKSWNDQLGKIAVSGGPDADLTTFYTSLYHSLVQPNVFSDVDGRYIGFDDKVHQADQGHAMYTNFSGWDIYRSEVPLLATIDPKQTSDIVRSMMAYAEQGGSWDRWTVANDYTGVMNGDPYHIIVSSAYAFGARDFDAKKALQLMVKGATQPTTGYTERPGLADYQKLGYSPGAGADTLEYTSADFSIAQFAKRLGDNDTYTEFMKRAQYWQNLYNPGTGHLQPRNADGSFSGTYDPASSEGWVEGNGAQYDWMVPYNLGGLVTAFGGNDATQSRLDEFFTKLNAGTQEPYAFMGNEPNSNAPFVYSYAGAPSKTQSIVHRSMDELYNPRPEGLIGNDDLGQMSSWYVWSALGIYPEIPGRSEFLLTTPRFEHATVTTGSGKKITVNAPGTGDYVGGLKVNGGDATKAWLPEGLPASGGTLDFTRSDTATQWGAAAADAPPSFRDQEKTSVSFVDPTRVVTPAGSTATATVGAQDLSGKAKTWTYQAGSVDGITTSPSSGKVEVPAAGKANAKITVTVPKGTADGARRIPITLSSPGEADSQVVLTVLVAEPNSWLAAVNNAGISPDSDSSKGNFDGGGWSYSADALAAAGATPGGTVTSDGLNFTWPSYPAGDPDNVVAAGQTVNIGGSGKLALLGSATNGKTQGTLTVTYTDGSTSTATVGFSDWTLDGGDSQPSFDNRTVLSTPYRNVSGGSAQQLATDVFGTAPITLDAGKTVASVTLPKDVDGGAMHVFAIAIG